MGRYRYSKKALRGLGAGPFLSQVRTREEHIAAAPADMPRVDHAVNELAAGLHPHVQFVKIGRIEEFPGAKSYELLPDPGRGTGSLAYFRAGQYISVAVEKDGKIYCKPYSISSAPGDALGKQGTSYTITVKARENGFISDFILSTWATGDMLIISGPLGQFYYQELRDAKHVVALAGGSGITPFLSMARAVADGTEPFDITILYGSRNAQNILLGRELEVLALISGGRIKLVNVLSDDDSPGYEHGLLTADMVRRYSPSGDYSVFVCGPRAMIDFEKEELKKLGLPPGRVRFCPDGEAAGPRAFPDYPEDAAPGPFKVTAYVRGNATELTCSAETTLLRAMEDAGLHVPSDCRSGECGWCHSRLISGEVFTPEQMDRRRMADRKFGWIHPCCAYPLSDVELEIFPMF